MQDCTLDFSTGDAVFGNWYGYADLFLWFIRSYALNETYIAK
jgi:hypothetical protein